MKPRNARRACFVWALLSMLTLGISIWDGSDYDIRTDGPLLGVPAKTTLRGQFGQDTLFTALCRGDSVRLIGIDRSPSGQHFLVQTARNEIGWIDAADFSNIRQIVTDGQDRGDTVSVKAVRLSRVVCRYKYTARDGAAKERPASGFMPALDGWQTYAYDRDGIAGISTEQKFERLAVGRTYDEVVGRFGRPVQLHRSGQGFVARYAWKAYDPASGAMRHPSVVFDKDSVATSVTYGDRTARVAVWLKRLPLSAQIIDLHATTVLMRSARYDRFSDPMPAMRGKVLRCCLLPFVALGIFLWLFAIPSLPTLLLGWLVAFPRPLAWFSDRWLRRTMLLLSLAAWYVWSVMTMAWGMPPWCALVGLATSFYFFRLASADLCAYPHKRCPACRRMYGIGFDREEFEGSEMKTGSEIVRGRLLGHRVSKWDSWTQVTTMTSAVGADGLVSQSSSTHREDLQHHTRHYRTYEMIDYKVNYRLDRYRQYWKCDRCGWTEETERVAWVEIDREEAGRHCDEVVEEHVEKAGR